MGSGAAIFSQVWRVLITFGVQLVLKRLVPAADWGLYEYVTLVVANFWEAPADPASLAYTYAAEELDQAGGPTAAARLVADS